MRRPLALIASLLSLAGCVAATDPADPAEVLRNVLATHQASLSGIAPRTPAAGGEGQAVAAVSVPAPPATADAATPPLLAGQLVGHAPETLTRWLGEPRLRRPEGSAEVWHYQATHCHLDLFFYRDEAAGTAMRVAFAQARAVGTARRGEAACLRDIARGAGLQPARSAAAGLTG